MLQHAKNPVTLTCPGFIEPMHRHIYPTTEIARESVLDRKGLTKSIVLLRLNWLNANKQTI